jgi:hypothetical protein
MAKAQVTLNTMDAKSKLAAATFDSLDAMMAAYADEAVRVARAEYGLRLDLANAESAERSVRYVEDILATLMHTSDSAAPAGTAASRQIDMEYATRLWGGYFGELLRRRYSGTWEMSVYPGGTLAVPTLEVKGSRLYPLMKVHRRLTLGSAEDLAAFYVMVVARLGEPVPAK